MKDLLEIMEMGSEIESVEGGESDIAAWSPRGGDGAMLW